MSVYCLYVVVTKEKAKVYRSEETFGKVRKQNGIMPQKEKTSIFTARAYSISRRLRVVCGWRHTPFDRVNRSKRNSVHNDTVYGGGARWTQMRCSTVCGHWPSPRRKHDGSHERTTRARIFKQSYVRVFCRARCDSRPVLIRLNVTYHVLLWCSGGVAATAFGFRSTCTSIFVVSVESKRNKRISDFRVNISMGISKKWKKTLPFRMYHFTFELK